jgi:hypothetical protein
MLTVGERGFRGFAGRECWRYHANTEPCLVGGRKGSGEEDGVAYSCGRIWMGLRRRLLLQNAGRKRKFLVLLPFLRRALGLV